MEYLIIKVKASYAASLEESLSFFDLDGIEIVNPQDSMYYNADWDEDEAPDLDGGDEALFKIYGKKDELLRLIEEYRNLILGYDFEEVVEKDWNQLWAQQFMGIEKGKLFIRPPWIDKKEGKLDVIIEPGMAFGTGSHETTLLCLGALLDYVKPGDSLYDVGTGSGILAVVAKILGAGFVKGIEIDEGALKNARLNASLNKQEILFSQGDLLKGNDRKAHIIVANILPSILVNLKEDAQRLLLDSGILILSGILDKRVEELLDFYSDAFSLRENKSMGQWHVLVLEKK